MSKLIETRPPSGFRDFPPAQMLAKERVLNAAREVYRSYGYAPIDTPAAENLDVLLGKGGEESDRLVYRVRGAKAEEAEMGLRFDLTVPFARFAARHVPEAGTPFKRYAMGPVWRGERPAQGRFREFWQCDFDTIGTTSNASDIEVALVICDLFKALKIDGFELRVNNRLVLNGVLQSLGLADKSVPVLRALDKLDKIGRDKVVEEMTREAGCTAELAGRVMDAVGRAANNTETLDRVQAEFGGNELVAEGVRRLRELIAVAEVATDTMGSLTVDLSIARGLDYYTGTIYETFLTGEWAKYGSVCSGGRYDNLASLYTRQVLPGVGASLGVDRLLAAMDEMRHPWTQGGSSPAPVLVAQLDPARLADCQRVASELRAAGIGTEVYPDVKGKGVQFQYAQKRGCRLGLSATEDDFGRGVWQVRDLTTKADTAVPATELAVEIRRRLG